MVAESPTRSRTNAVMWSVAVTAGTVVTTVLAVSAAQGRWEATAWPASIQWLATISFVCSLVLVFVLPVMVWWRHRSDRVVWLIGLFQLVLPVGPVMAFVLPAYLRRTSRADGLKAAALHVIGTLGWIVRDSLGTLHGSSVTRMLAASPPDFAPTDPVPFSLASAVLIFALFTVTPIALGRNAATTRELAARSGELRQERAHAERVVSELELKDEREAIAREVHDAIGHRLSMIHLYASGLELAAKEADPELADNATLVRTETQKTVDDLRSLVRLMRQPGSFAANSAATAPRSLSDIAHLADEQLAASQQCSSSVSISDPDKASATLVRAAYRIVQELLTNAARHAPGSRVWLSVKGGPGQGVTIDVTNDVVESAAPAGPGSGLRGVAERAELLGGWATMDRGDKRFAVRVFLPWQG